MSIVELSLLGLVQGLTEFLPVSSSGHLVILQGWLGTKEEGSGALLEVILHVGTLIPVLWIFRAQVAELVRVSFAPSRWRAGTRGADVDEGAELFRFVSLATVVTAVIALPLEPVFEPLFSSPRSAGFALLVTTGLLFASRFVREREPGAVTAVQALIVGAAQALAVTPGISRSGTTIVVGLLVGVPLVKVGAFSFLMSIPAICGALLMQLLKHPVSGFQWEHCLIGVAVAGLSGYLAIRWTLRCINTRKLHWFAPYTLALALLVLLGVGDEPIRALGG